MKKIIAAVFAVMLVGAFASPAMASVSSSTDHNEYPWFALAIGAIIGGIVGAAIGVYNLKNK